MKHLFTLSEWLRAKWERLATLASSAMPFLKATKRQSDTTIFAERVQSTKSIFANRGVKDVRVSLGQYPTDYQRISNLYLTPNRFFTRFAAVFALVFVLGVGNVWGAVPTGWSQVTSLSGMSAGDKIIIVTNDGTKYLNGSISSGKKQHFSASDLTTSSPSNASAAGVILLESTGTANKYKLKLVSTSKYITATSTNSGSASVSVTSDSYGWTFTFSDGTFDAQYQESGKNAYCRSYNNSDFRTYGSKSGDGLKIYKYSSTPSYTINAQSNNTSWGTVSGTSTITASPKAGYRVSTSSPYSVSPANSATVSQNGNTFTVTPSANTTITINFEAIPTHKISFNTGGLVSIADATGIQEGAVYNITQTPAASLTPSCEYGTFVGWTTTSSIANANICPSIVTSVTMSTSDVTLNAVYSKTTGGGGNNGSIELTTETENFPTAYGTANKFTEYTLEGKKFKIQQGYVNGTKLQWRASGNSNGTGIIYNTEVFPAKITSVVLVYDNSDNNKNFTLNVSDTENPTSGTAITPSSEGNTYTFDCSEENADYFVLANGSGAGYLTSITINYGSNGTTSYSLDANCCQPLGQINGSINLSHF